MQLILDFQLRRHLQCSRSFKENFRKVDGDEDGVLTTSEFVELAKRTLECGNRVQQERLARDDAASVPPVLSDLAVHYSSSEGRRSSMRLRPTANTSARHQRGRRRNDELITDHVATRKAEEEMAAEATQLLEAADPRLLGGITFSECLKHLAFDIAAGLAEAPDLSTLDF